jgi:tRNA (mo5U34)-methyltransferase
MDLGGGVATPGWSKPVRQKLRWFGLPDDLTGKRLLDIGCTEGLVSFEAERRGAREVVAVDKGEAPGDNAARIKLCADALGSQVTIRSASVHELNPDEWGTFDVVFFFGAPYHVTEKATALDDIASVTAGTLLLQTSSVESRSMRNTAIARLYPEGVMTGPIRSPVGDRSAVWAPSAKCVQGLLERSGFQ